MWGRYRLTGSIPLGYMGREPAGPLNAKMMEFFFCSGDITCTLEALALPSFSKKLCLMFCLGFMPVINSPSAGMRMG